ncbi:Ger(x)C family spore germination protein [Pontibacillus yanchengensis]|nr:Ger(x)C family spore germination protein [Pontibacillus yanchengensis]
MMLLFLCTVLFLTSCVEKKHLEQIGIVTAVGFDMLEEEGWLEGTHVLFQFDPNGANISQIITTRAKTAKGLMNDASLKTSKKLASGQLRLVLFGEKIAQEGAMRLLDTLARDAAIADMMYIAVSETTANKVLQANNFEDAPNIGTYIHQLIEKNVKEEKVPQSTLHDFLHHYYDQSSDPILPIINEENSKPTIRNLAVFQDDRMVGSISVKEGFHLKLLTDKFTAGHLEMVIPPEPFIDKDDKDRHYNEIKGIYLDLGEITSNANIEVVDVENIEFKVNINIKARILEISEAIKMEDPKVVKKLGEIIGKNIEQQSEELIQKLQEMNSDPVGFGLKYQRKVGPEALADSRWREIFPQMKVKVNVDTQILRSGIIN